MMRRSRTSSCSPRTSWLSSVALLLVGGLALDARAAETDNYWAWHDPPPDSTYRLERHIEREMRRTLEGVNAWPFSRQRECHEVSADLLLPFSYTGVWHFVGTMDGWGLRYTPRTNRAYFERYEPVGIYRYASRPLPGSLVPLDPTIRVADVNIGLDKIGHFLLNGRRYYDRYRAALARGDDEESALLYAIELGLEQENGILGMGISSIFSYADLEANFQGLELFRWLCDDDDPALQQRDGRWELTKPLDLGRFVNPCWDESFAPNAFGEDMAPGVLRALEEQCPLLETKRVVALRAGYRAKGCDSFSHRYVMKLVEEGKLPDPRPFDIDNVCRAKATAPAAAPSATP